MDMLLEFAGVSGPAIAGLLTVPALQGVKALSRTIDKAPAAVKQALGVTIAFGLNKAGAAANVALPESLELFDGSHTEALISSGIAFGVHAGQKARQNAPRMLALLLVGASLVAPRAATAQVASDSVEVEIIDPDDISVSITPDGYSGMVGDTVTFSASAVDEFTGDDVTAVYDWSTSNPDAVEITDTSEDGDGSEVEIVFTERGTITIRVEVERVAGIVLGELLEDGSVRFFEAGETLELEEGQQARLCFYLENPAGRLIARDKEQCPFPSSTPAWAPTMPVISPERRARVG